MTNKKFTVRDLTKAGFIRHNELNFKDDGALFQVLEFEGMYVSYTKYFDQYFLAIRPDYCNEKTNFTFKEWMETEEWKLQDEFNGCFEINVEKLIENIRKINAKRAEMNTIGEKEAEENTKNNAEEIISRLEDEFVIAEDAIDTALTLDWINADDYTIKQVKSCVKSLMSYKIGIETLLKRVNACEASAHELMMYAKRIRETGYYLVKIDNYYVGRINELVKNK